MENVVKKVVVKEVLVVHVQCRSMVKIGFKKVGESE